MPVEETWKHHEDAIEWFKKLGSETWTPLYLPGKEELLPGGENRFLWSCLLFQDSVAREMEKFGFDQFDGYPATGESGGDTGTSYYLRYGEEDREPIFFRRHFPTLPSYLEVSQEFVHFFQLHHNRERDEFIRELEDGSEEVVLKFENGGILVRTLRLRQFLAFKGMVLLVGLSNIRKFDSALASEEKEGRLKEEQTDYLNYILTIWQGDFDGLGNSRLLGKKIIFPMPIEETGIYPFEKPEEFEEFIIGVDDQGRENSFTCNPDELGNFFGKNPEAPNFLTPVFFSKEVLERYYSRPEKYSVDGGGIQIGNCYLQADTDHSDYVIVFLGDLGQDIPLSEQRYWRRFNVPPDGKMSESYFRRSILAEFAAPEAPNFVFAEKLLALQAAWSSKFGWDLIKPLAKEDEYRLQTLRIPARGNQKGFDEAVTNLNIILVESLNDSALSSKLTSKGIAIAKDDKSISKLEKFFAAECADEDYIIHTNFLRLLQKLRSKGGAHRKSRAEYEKDLSRLGIQAGAYDSGFEELLKQAIAFVDFMEDITKR